MKDLEDEIDMEDVEMVASMKIKRLSSRLSSIASSSKLE